MIQDESIACLEVRRLVTGSDRYDEHLRTTRPPLSALCCGGYQFAMDRVSSMRKFFPKQNPAALYICALIIGTSPFLNDPSAYLTIIKNAKLQPFFFQILGIVVAILLPSLQLNVWIAAFLLCCFLMVEALVTLVAYLIVLDTSIENFRFVALEGVVTVAYFWCANHLFFNVKRTTSNACKTAPLAAWFSWFDR